MIYNSIGQTVYKNKSQLINGAEYVNINSSKWSRGNYILQVVAGDVNLTKSLIK